VELRHKPETFPANTARVVTPCGKVYVILGRDPDGLLDVRLVFGKAGGCVATWAEAVSRLASLMLRAGFTKHEIADELKGLACQQGDNVREHVASTCLHQIAEVLEGASTGPDSDGAAAAGDSGV
jgi:ribonucleoside-diphosphate reductase alpha chain